MSRAIHLTWPLPLAPQSLTTFSPASLMITTVWKEPAYMLVTGATSESLPLLLLLVLLLFVWPSTIGAAPRSTKLTKV